MKLDVPEHWYVTLNSAAQALGAPKSQIDEMVESGELTCVEHSPGGHRRFQVVEVLTIRERMLEQQRTGLE